jgi:hypothetical protein
MLEDSPPLAPKYGGLVNSAAWDGKIARFEHDGVFIGDANIDNVDRLYEVTIGNTLESNDGRYWVVALEKSAIVVPDDTEGFEAVILPAWKPALLSSGRFTEIQESDVPNPWRKRFLFIPLLKPRLADHSLKTLPPSWPRPCLHGAGHE